MNIHSTPSCCTAKIITGWSYSIKIDNSKKLSKNNFNKDRLRDLKSQINGNFRGYGNNALFYVILTQIQYDKGMHEVLVDGLKFTYAFQGNKGLKSSQDHPETGHLHMYCCDLATFQDGPKNFESWCHEMDNGFIKFNKDRKFKGNLSFQDILNFRDSQEVKILLSSTHFVKSTLEKYGNMITRNKFFNLLDGEFGISYETAVNSNFKWADYIHNVNRLTNKG